MSTPRYCCHGRDHELHPDSLYFSCGGSIESSTSRVTAPYFPDTHSHLYTVEHAFICEWNLKKTGNQSYGCLVPVNVTGRHCSVEMTSTTKMKVWENVDGSEAGEPSASESSIEMRTHHTNTSVVTNSQTESGRFTQDICGSHIRMVAFQGPYATLYYFSKPSRYPEFIADYSVIHIPDLGKGKKSFVFEPYRYFIIFVSLGILISIMIMHRQGWQCEAALT